MRRAPDLRDGGDEAARARVQQVARLRAALGGAPGRRLGVLLRRVARRLAEGDEPHGEAVVRDAAEDAVELASVVLPCAEGGRAGGRDG